MISLPRRQALAHWSRLCAGAALASLFGARPVHGNSERLATWPGELGPPFTLGVASGQPRPSSVVLWTRLAPRPHEPLGGLPPLAVPVHWQLALDEQFAHVVREGVQDAVAEHAFSVHVLVGGLPPAQPYFYRFIAGDAVSRVGRTRTAPAADAQVDRLRLALASCQHYEHGRFAVHREIAARDLDFVLFVGDYIYESTSPHVQVRLHEGPPPTTLDGYRARHATYKLDLDLQASHAAHPWLLVWDDHEVRNDYAGERTFGPFDADAFLRLRTAAYKAYFEHMPVAPDQLPVDGAMRMHDHFGWGRLAGLWTLDGRQHRSLQACGAPGQAQGRLRWHCGELADPARSVFGPAQERWLMQGLADHRDAHTWKLLAQATQMSSWGVDMALARGIYTDGWDGYPRARERLLQHVHDAGLANVVNLGGDVHRHVAANLRLAPNDTASPVLASEFVTSSISSRGLPEMAMQAVRRSNPDLLHARSDERGYALIEATPALLHCEFRAAAFPVAEQARLHTQARYAVEAGRAGPQAA
jgi:alkaline phosphatase D